MGLTKNSLRCSLWFVELVGKALIKYLEFSFVVLNVMCMEGA